jgi:hypothetical protein
MSYVSNWKLTIDPAGTPRVVVTHGQKITDELSLAWIQQTQQAPALRRVPMANFGRGNVTRELTFGVYTDHATDKDARNWMWALDIAADGYALTTFALRMEILGGNTYNMASCVLTECSSQMVQAGVARTLTTWRFLRGTAA